MWNNYVKPNFIGEFGAVWGTAQTTKHFRDGIWAGFAAGGAITPLDWNDGGGWEDLTPEMYDHGGYLVGFASGIPFDQLGLSPVTLSIGSEFKAWGMKGSNLGYLWVQDTSPGEVNTGVSLTITGLTDGLWELRWYNTWTGSYDTGIIEDTSSGSSMTTTVPDFTNDIACKLSYPGDTPTITSICLLNGNKLYLVWTKVIGAQYNIYRDTDPDFTPATPVATDLTDSTYIDTDAGIVGDPDNNYFYIVTAIVGEAESWPSNRVGEFDVGLLNGAK